MQKKNYFKIIIAVVAIFLIQFIYFNYVATRNTGEIQRANAQIESLHETVAELNTQLESSSRKSFVNSHQLPATIVFCYDTLDMKDQLFRERLEREFYSLLSKQGQIQLYLKRSIKYTQMIERYLKENDLPLDLKYLAIHESALLPKIRSRSNAVGLWQFMHSTGRLYRLKINRYIDERRDPEMATRAAMRFIKEMYRYYENWPLVMAAYNGGHGRVSRALKAQNSDSFFDLSLPEETERYYFMIVATKMLLSNAEKYGFYLEEKDLFTPIPSIKIQYQIKEERKSVEDISKQYKLSQAEFKYFNPKIIGSYLPRGKYEFNIPEEKYNSLVMKRGSENKGNFSEEDVPPYKNSGGASTN
jgi:membrane-bound lytic murein transglycosylase D